MDGNTDTTLKPCPFCGASASMRRGGRYGFWALCQHCGAALRMSDTEEDAANAWNRRATEAEGNQATQEEPSSGANPDAETVADIRAWLANGEVERCLAAITDTDAMHDMLTAVADRIEAAAERERVKARRDAEIEWARIGYEERKAEEKREPGNAAAMREALNQLRDWALLDINENAIRSDETNYQKLVDGIVEITNAALSAPPRNCDRYGDEDDAFAAWHDALNDGDVVSVRNAFAWLFAKAEGGAE